MCSRTATAIAGANERLLTVGPAAFSDAELLVLVLGVRRPPWAAGGVAAVAHQRLPETKAAVVLAAVELARRLALADIPERHPLTSRGRW